MTESEIMKALECCSRPVNESCSECPLNSGDCMGMSLEKEAIDLINRKNAEIERIFTLAEQGDKKLYETLDYRAEKIRELESEIDRLEKAIEVQKIMLGNQDYAIKKARAEAIKEVLERVKKIDLMQCLEANCYGEEYPDEELFHNAIDQIAKEMGVE